MADDVGPWQKFNPPEVQTKPWEKFSAPKTDDVKKEQ